MKRCHECKRRIWLGGVQTNGPEFGRRFWHFECWHKAFLRAVRRMP